MKTLLTMWFYPRMIAWFFLTAVLELLVRLPFAKFQMIPHYLDFHPGVVLVPLAGIFFGPAGAWGSLAASLLGDRLLGLWGMASAFRAAGFFLFALSARRLWDFSWRSDSVAAAMDPIWSRTGRFMLAAWPGCFIAASWQGLGSEVLRSYPFSYVASLLVMNNLLFCTLLGLPLYRLVARYGIPRFGTWRETMGLGGVSSPTTPLDAFFVAAGGLGACMIGWYAGRLFYHVGPMQPMVLGSYCGILVPVCVVPFLILQIVGLFRGTE